MPPLSLATFSASMKNYVQTLNNNSAAIEAAVNALQAQVLAAVGDGADLILDVFDRVGVVGTHSYVLDLENYGGGAEITIGRRPAPNIPAGEDNVSIAWGVFSGEWARVTQTDDVVLDATTITSGLPKTIYVGIASDGTPQFFETDSVPNVIYVYSMTWNAYELTDFRRLAALLPAYSLLQKIAGQIQVFSKYDVTTDWLSDLESRTGIVLPGSIEENELVDGSYEVLGFVFHFDETGGEGFTSPVGDDNKVVLQVVSGTAVPWTDEIEIDASLIPNDIFVPVLPEIGSDVFVTEIRRFSLERLSMGAHQVSAENFTWGVIVRPLYGLEVPKDGDFVGLI